ncbi:MAG: hypothetical protein ACOC2H_09670 [Spirochaetota bacterium]
MTVQQLINRLETLDRSKDVHFQTLTEFGYDDGSRFGKHVDLDFIEENSHPNEILFRLVYKH